MVRYFCSFYGFNLYTILPYVTFLSFVAFVFEMKITVFVPFTVLITWANWPSSFTKDRSQHFLSWPWIRCLYSWATPYIWRVSALDYLTCRNCAANAKFGIVFLLQLDINLVIGPPVSTLGGCAGRTLGGGTGTSERMMCVPEGDMWTLRWKSVELFPSSSCMMLGRSEGICLACVGRTLWGIGEDFVNGCCCGGSNVWCILAATLEKYLTVSQSLPFGSCRC